MAAGVTAFLFTDLVRSTETRERMGDDGFESLRRTHFRLLREAVTASGGEEVKSLGDGLMVAFPSTLAAVSCSVAMQQAVERHNHRQREQPLTVRIGLHVGEPIKEGSDYFGRPVVMAQRLCAAAQPEQILCSKLVRDLVGTRGEFTFRSIGPVELRGFSEPLPACVVDWEHVAEEALPFPPALQALECPPYVGREEQLQQLHDHWKQARGGVLEIAFLVGEPGIGKTPLTIAFARSVHREGGTVLYGRCDEEAVLPYQPFVEALRHHVATCPMEELWALPEGCALELARLVPTVTQRLAGSPRRAATVPEPPPAGEEAETERYRLFDAVVAVLRAATRDRPVLLVLDDLHWADRATLLLLRHLVRDALGIPMMILGNYRDSEIGRTHPLSEALTALRGERAVRRIVVRGLDEQETMRLIEAAAPERLKPGGLALARRLYRETEGNPFFIQEIVRHLGESDPTPGYRPMELPESITDVVGRRLSRLGDDANRALSVASVIGREFSLGVLDRVSELSEDTLIDLVEEAVGHRVVTEVPGAADRYAFAHALIRDTIYRELTTSRKVRLHRRIGEVIADLHADDLEPHLGELAYHFSESAALGDVERAIDYATQAARRAVSLRAYEDAIRLYEMAVQSIEMTEAPDPRHLEEILRERADLERAVTDGPGPPRERR